MKNLNKLLAGYMVAEACNSSLYGNYTFDFEELEKLFSISENYLEQEGENIINEMGKYAQILEVDLELDTKTFNLYLAMAYYVGEEQK